MWIEQDIVMVLCFVVPAACCAVGYILGRLGL